MENRVLIWLDDVRNPYEGDWLVNWAPKNDYTEIVWLKSYRQFTEWISEHGLPYCICFDHDLGHEYYWEETHPPKEDGTPADAHLIKYDEWQGEEKTGYHCAKWLVEYIMDNGGKLPFWSIQSSNTQGRDNIEFFLKNAAKHLDI